MADEEKDRGEKSVEALAARAIVALDDLKALLLAASLEATERDVDALGEEQARLQRAAGGDDVRLDQIASRITSTEALVPELIGRFERSIAPRQTVPSDAAVVSGRVFDKDTSVGLAGAVVVATSPHGATLAKTTTDAYGRFEVAVADKSAASVSLEVKSGRTTLHLDARPAKLAAGQRAYRDVAIGGAAGRSKTGGTTSRASAARPTGRQKE